MSICAPTPWLKPRVVGVISYLIVLATPAAQAQIQPDASLGPTPSQLRTDANGQLIIEGGASRGTALFHSFSDFNIAPDGNASFANPNGIETILTRVTGDRSSNLLGTLGVLGNADLFFINPNGITFGPQSTLDLNGSFIASTAEKVVLANDFTFSATQPQPVPPTLTVSVPTGLQFGPQPGPIQYAAVSSRRSRGLAVQSGQTLALLGGPFDFQGAKLEAFGGGIELGSIGGTGTVEIDAIAQGFLFDYSGIEAFDDFAASSTIISTRVEDPTTLGSNAQDGSIKIQAQDIDLNSFAFILASTITDLPGGNITVNARRLNVSGGSSISARVTASAGEADIQGTGGDVVVNASESVSINGARDFGRGFISPSAISANLDGDRPDFFGNFIIGSVLGDGGNVTINTKRLQITEGATLSTESNTVGNAGNITINASELIEVSGVFMGETASLPTTLISAGAEGAGGRIQLNTQRLLVQDGAALFSDTTGSGAGGSIDINADIVDVIGSKPIPNSLQVNELPSSIAVSAQDQGDAGQILINARRLNVNDGGIITAETLPGSSGNGNLLTINATDRVQIAGRSEVGQTPSALLSRSAGRGKAGTVQVNTASLELLSSGQISAATLDETAESSGSLALRVERLLLDEGALTVETFAQQGSGANIAISDLEVLLLRNGSQISAEALNGADGGNILLDAPDGFVVATLQGDSNILARANRGNGGEIAVVAQSILGLEERLATPDNGTNDIDASSQFGLSGSVILNQLALDPSQGTAELPTNTEAPQISRQCNPRQGDSSFVATGRGGAPPAPNAVVPSLLWSPGAGSEASVSSAAIAPLPNPNQPIVEAQGWTTSANGTVQLTTLPSNSIPYTTLTAQATCSLSPA